MSVQNLTNTTWLINDEPWQDSSYEDESYNITFESNNTQYSALRLYNDFTSDVDIYYGSTLVWNGWTATAPFRAWSNNAYKTIVITGGTDVTNATLIEWLENNATQQGVSVTKLVNATELDANLTSVANAIRAKSGGSGTLAFPNGFVSEIQSIPTGGGGGDVSYEHNKIYLHYITNIDGLGSGSVTWNVKVLAGSSVNAVTVLTKTFTDSDESIEEELVIDISQYIDTAARLIIFVDGSCTGDGNASWQGWLLPANINDVSSFTRGYYQSGTSIPVVQPSKYLPDGTLFTGIGVNSSNYASSACIYIYAAIYD